MIKGIGTDIVLNSRFSTLSEHIKERLFTKDELEEGRKRVDSAVFFASRFAAKEAISKAFGTGFKGISAIDIEIKNNEEGKPYALIRGKLDNSILLSISHEKEYSIAFALWKD